MGGIEYIRTPDYEAMKAKIDELRAALKPFAEIAQRMGWDKLGDDDVKLGEHVIDAPADDIAPGAFYCLMVGAFRGAAKALTD